LVIVWGLAVGLVAIGPGEGFAPNGMLLINGIITIVVSTLLGFFGWHDPEDATRNAPAAAAFLLLPFLVPVGVATAIGRLDPVLAQPERFHPYDIADHAWDLLGWTHRAWLLGLLSPLVGILLRTNPMPPFGRLPLLGASWAISIGGGFMAAAIIGVGA
jgi:hypothetical protein